MELLATIGVYGASLDAFLAALGDAGVDVVLDVRQRRGVRGREYAWANSLRLQAALRGAGVAYLHVRELAPTTELRQLQYREDARQGVGKRSREVLAAEYRHRYVREVLDGADLDAVLERVRGHRVPALLCVERDARACHRSLVAQRIHERCGVGVVDVIPPFATAHPGSGAAHTG